MSAAKKKQGKRAAPRYERPKFRVLKPTLNDTITTTINSSSRKASRSSE